MSRQVGALLALSLVLGEARSQVLVDRSGDDGGNGVSLPFAGTNGGDGDNGSTVRATNNGDFVTGLTAVTGRSNGGDGGNGGSGVGIVVSDGGEGGDGGNGGSVTVTNRGNIGTVGMSRHGILGESVGGNGGDGGDSNVILGVYGEAGDGGLGGAGGSVSISNFGEILTQAGSSQGIFAQSLGGIAGFAGDANNIGLIAVAGEGSSAGNGGRVTVNNRNQITTRGSGSNGIFAQSIGGFSGNSGGGLGLFSLAGARKVPATGVWSG